MGITNPATREEPQSFRNTTRTIEARIEPDQNRVPNIFHGGDDNVRLVVIVADVNS